MFPRTILRLRLSKSVQTVSRTCLQQRNQATASDFKAWRAAATKASGNMATPSKIVLTTEDTGIFKFKDQDQETATKVSELLQENHDVRSQLFTKHVTNT